VRPPDAGQRLTHGPWFAAAGQDVADLLDGDATERLGLAVSLQNRYPETAFELFAQGRRQRGGARGRIADGAQRLPHRQLVEQDAHHRRIDGQVVDAVAVEEPFGHDPVELAQQCNAAPDIQREQQPDHPGGVGQRIRDQVGRLRCCRQRGRQGVGAEGRHRGLQVGPGVVMGEHNAFGPTGGAGSEQHQSDGATVDVGGDNEAVGACGRVAGQRCVVAGLEPRHVDDRTPRGPHRGVTGIGDDRRGCHRLRHVADILGGRRGMHGDHAAAGHPDRERRGGKAFIVAGAHDDPITARDAGRHQAVVQPDGRCGDGAKGPWPVVLDIEEFVAGVLGDPPLQ
jgi:hypothetical protein